jgi:hypothetical protein
LSTGNTLINNPMWEPFSVRFAGTYNAPLGMVVSSSYTISGGPWSGPIINQIAANDPSIAVFGPSTVTSSTGVKQPNPLATRIRFYYPTRGEGQLEQPAVHIVGLKIAKRFQLGSARQLEVAANAFNLLNGGNFSEFNRSGANRIYSPSTYNTGTTLQEARAYQINGVFRF